MGSVDSAPIGGEVEIRARDDGGRTLAGSFPYGRTATRRDRGRVRKEQFGPHAFSWRMRQWAELQREAAEALQGAVDEARRQVIEDQLLRADIHVLRGHDFDMPLGSLSAGTARIWDDAAAVRFEVDLPDDNDAPSWVSDTIKAVQSKLATGVSPGFRIPPRAVVADAEALVPEDGNPGVFVRLIRQASLYELSIVTRPHYGGTDVDVRDYIERPARRRWWV
ncbi:MAG: HK97 family phage prohead protease [Spirochaetaceae bacterium]|nr:HK97 family phage prohead protease [Spirochaetaceae bacterium]